MSTLKKSAIPVFSFLFLILFSSWGYRGHKKVNENAPPSFPPSLSFLLGSFSSILVDSALAPDNRKDWDDSESPKHYIDIDNYPEFIYSRKIPQSWDSIIRGHGLAFVLDNGTVPWSTLITFDSLRSCFARQNWEKAALFAADLGHYVGDAHNPLHLTNNFDGQNTGQDGLHWRYETKMLNSFHSQIIYPFDSVQLITNVQGYIFSYIYANYVYVDSVLKADRDATTFAGNNNSSVYTQALWDRSKSFTIPLFHHASYALASLIYTAYVESLNMAVHENNSGFSRLGSNYPNPVNDYTIIPFDIGHNNTFVSVRIYDGMGNIKEVLYNEIAGKGHHEIRWDANQFSAGLYYCVFEAGDVVVTRKLMVVR